MIQICESYHRKVEDCHYKKKYNSISEKPAYRVAAFDAINFKIRHTAWSLFLAN